MKHLAYTTLLLACFTMQLSAQTHKVISAVTKAGLPYAVVTNNAGKGIYTDEQGVFDISSINKTDSLSFYCVGYERITIASSKLPASIMLQPLTRTMNEVVIKSEVPVKTIHYPKRGMPFVWSSSVGMELATRINFLPEDKGALKKLKEVRIRIKHLDENNPCRLHIYEATPADTPGKELLMKDIILRKEHATRIAFIKDLSAEDIYLTADAVFVGIEWIGMKKKPVEQDHNKPHSVYPFLRMTESIPETRTYMRVMGYPLWKATKSIHGSNNPPNMVVSLSYQ